MAATGAPSEGSCSTACRSKVRATSGSPTASIASPTDNDTSQCSVNAAASSPYFSARVGRPSRKFARESIARINPRSCGSLDCSSSASAATSARRHSLFARWLFTISKLTRALPTVTNHRQSEPLDEGPHQTAPRLGAAPSRSRPEYLLRSRLLGSPQN